MKVNDRAMTLTDGAKRLGISKWTLRKLGVEGKIKIFRPSPRCTRVWESEIERLAAETVIAKRAVA